MRAQKRASVIGLALGMSRSNLHLASWLGTLGLILVACSGSSSGGAPASDASADGAGGYPCGAVVCAAGQVCCQDPTGQRTCTASGACLGIASTCASAKDCAQGQVCCGSYPSPTTIQIACAAECSGPSTFQPCASSIECPSGKTCLQGLQVSVCARAFLDAGDVDSGAAADGAAD
jgi:hypothetical protein